MEECKDLEMAQARQLVSAMHSPEILSWMSKICDVSRLLDLYPRGAGYMKSYKGDSLKIHLTLTGMKNAKLSRALSPILYFTPRLNQNGMETYSFGL